MDCNQVVAQLNKRKHCMTIKSDKWITKQEGMITPFFGDSVSKLESGKKVPSFGLSSYGYDVRLGKNFKFFGTATRGIPHTDGWLVTRFVDGVGQLELFSPALMPSKEIDPCNFDPTVATELANVDELLMPPQSFCLAVSMERIKVPRNVSVVCMGKSTIARAGIIVIVTPLEAEWEGYITLEITNTTRMPVRLTAGMGITQLQFIESDEQCEVSYKDRNGKYQDQPAEAVAPRQL